MRPYGIRPNNIWIDDVQAEGYLENDFTETFRRYISQSDLDALTAQVEQRRPLRFPVSVAREPHPSSSS